MLLKKRILFSLAAGAFLSVVLLSFLFVKLSVNGQNSLVFLASEVAESNRATASFIKKTASTSIVGFNAAAAENARLMNSLVWTFGAKPQRGWQIYVPIIQQTIGTEKAAETPEFAVAVAAWQQKFGLAPTGKLDDETLLKMVAWWQSRRLNSSRYPSDEELVSAPITDFYDPMRAPDLLKVERETYAAYKKMVAAAAKDLNLRQTPSGELVPEEKFLRIVSAFRSREYQAKLRAASPHSGRAGLAVNSPHFTGQALDIYVGGEPTITKDINRLQQVRTPAYKWLVKNAERFGFRPYYYEPWHWEYVGTKPTEID
jgi:uncharacterized protein YcbK (DUF882 family)